MTTPYSKYYACFTAEQQEFYNTKLTAREQLYVDFRGQGFNKSDSIRNAGYDSKYASGLARNIETNKPIIKDMIEAIQKDREDQSNVAKQPALDVDVIAKMIATDGDKAMEALSRSPDEMAKRINFYQRIVAGDLKTRKITQEIDPKTNLVIKKKIEETDDVAIRIKAREKLDELLGIKNINLLEKLKVNDITINFVDAGKKEELDDQRNKVDLNINEVEVEATPVKEGDDE